MQTSEQILHASCVSFAGNAVLIMGRAGAGKSSLALTLMALGCELVADDRTQIAVKEGHLIATCPPAISGLIEARGFGLLPARVVENAKVVLIVDLDQAETERLPQEKSVRICGISVRCVHVPDNSAFPFAILQYLRTHDV